MRWPVIIFSRICVFGESFDVFPVSKMPTAPHCFSDSRDPTVSPLFLLPSEIADAEVRSIHSGCLGASAAMAAAAFLLDVRGLPLAELDVECGDEIYKIISSKNQDFREILTAKCKLLCAKQRVIMENTEIFSSVVADDVGTLCAVSCSNADAFSDTALRRLPLCVSDSLGITAPDGAVAFSRSGEGVVARGVITSDQTRDRTMRLARAAARAAGCGSVCEQIRVVCNGVVFTVRHAENRYGVSSLPTRPLTFIAPDVS